MSSTVEEVFEAPKGKYLVDFYGDWSRAEGAPVHATNAPLDLTTIATGDWKRFGLRGAVCDLAGDCDFLAAFLVEPSTTWSAPQHHLYEEVCYVVCGEGETEVDLGHGRKHLIPWRQGSLFSAPMNATYRHRATSGAPTRLACANDLRSPLPTSAPVRRPELQVAWPGPRCH